MNIKEPLISIVCPVFGCSDSLKDLYARLKESMQEITDDYEIILVNDASPDKSTWNIISGLSKIDNRVKGINLSRNFGQHYAINAGLDHCKGEWIVVMDCDLQDMPEEIKKLYDKAKEGYLIVFARRYQRKDKWSKRLFSKWFYLVLGYLTDTDQDPAIANFGIFNKKVIASVLSMKDYHRFFPTMVRWVGFEKAIIDVEHSQRQSGKSNYSLGKMVKLAIDVILSYSDKPLKLIIKLGFAISALSIMFAIYNLILYLNNTILVPGYTSLIISIWLLSGIIITIVGVVGLYVGKTFDKVKGRPTYVIKEKTFLN